MSNYKNNYKDVIQNAKYLQDEFKGKLTPYEALKIATQIQLTDVIQDSFQAGIGAPTFLEAIAMQLGYQPQGKTTISEAILELARAIAIK